MNRQQTQHGTRHCVITGKGFTVPCTVYSAALSLLAKPSDAHE